MNIMQALKKIKHLSRKIESNEKRIVRWCSHEEDETSPYDMRKLMQTITDLVKEKARIRAAIHATNVTTLVDFKNQKWSLDGLLAHRLIVLPAHIKALGLFRRRERGRMYAETKPIKYILEYDPQWRDDRVEAIQDEMADIDNLLDVTNLSTEIKIEI